ncbi:MAG: hypothetical protein QW818_02500 [Candidatus Aenigmatarchaeota archaeon]
MSNIKKIQKIKKQAREIIEAVLTPQTSISLGNVLVPRMKTRITLGYGVDAQGKQTIFKPLSKNYIELRKKFSSNLSKRTRPKKSNVTATGQMIDAMRAVPASGKIVIEISGRRSRELTGAVPSGDLANNATIARFVEKGGRPFFAATNAEKQFLIREIKFMILKKLRF